MRVTTDVNVYEANVGVGTITAAQHAIVRQLICTETFPTLRSLFLNVSNFSQIRNPHVLRYEYLIEACSADQN